MKFCMAAWVAVFVSAGCDVGGRSGLGLQPDAPTPDAAPAALNTVHVSPVGNDAADGVTAPVKTIVRAFAIAKGNGEITTITVAAGRYDAANGDTYPQVVPANVKIEGPGGGGVVLAGDRSGPGLVLETGELVNLTLEDFSVALRSTGGGKLTAIQIHSSGVALRAERSARLDASDLTIAGLSGACATGIQVAETASISVSGLRSQVLGTHVDVEDQSVAVIMNAQISGNPACTQPLFTVASSKSVTIADSTFDGGGTAIQLAPVQPLGTVTTVATLTNTTIKHATVAGLAGTAQVSMMGGGLSSNNVGIDAVLGDWHLQQVAITDNTIGIKTRDSFLLVNESTLTDNTTGIQITQCNCNISSSTLRSSSVSIDATDVPGGTRVNASGNTWLANTQGADGQGQYPAMEIVGPANGANFALGSQIILDL